MSRKSYKQVLSTHKEGAPKQTAQRRFTRYSTLYYKNGKREIKGASADVKGFLWFMMASDLFLVILGFIILVFTLPKISFLPVLIKLVKNRINLMILLPVVLESLLLLSG